MILCLDLKAVYRYNLCRFETQPASEQNDGKFIEIKEDYLL